MLSDYVNEERFNEFDAALRQLYENQDTTIDASKYIDSTDISGMLSYMKIVATLCERYDNIVVALQILSGAINEQK